MAKRPNASFAIAKLTCCLIGELCKGATYACSIDQVSRLAKLRNHEAEQIGREIVQRHVSDAHTTQGLVCDHVW